MLFEADTLMLFRECITMEMVMEANEFILSRREERNGPPLANSSGKGQVPEKAGDRGTLTLDATCAPSHIYSSISPC